MDSILIITFIVGYLLIVLEGHLGINKAAFALIMCGVLWSIVLVNGDHSLVSEAIISHLGDTAEILLFLIGAMTIVDLIDRHDGFDVITKRITCRNKIALLWVLVFITFFMSAVLDNMTTTIIMIVLLRKLLSERKDVMLFASMIVIAANSGGAWSPIGDVTTLMLWMKENVTSLPLVSYLIVPCIVSVVVPAAFVSMRLRGTDMECKRINHTVYAHETVVGKRFRISVLVLGVMGLLSVPILKTFVGLPPYMSALLSLGVIWIVTDCAYNHKTHIDERRKNRVVRVLRKIDMSTILFFFGILMAVSALQYTGILSRLAELLDGSLHNVYAIVGSIGVISSIVDNVPLVAACMGMYPVVDPVTLTGVADSAYLMNFVQDGPFWQLLAYCAGVGGSMLIIGSAAGVVAMGLEKINFGWYFKNITLLAFLGYVAGLAIIFLEDLIFKI
ncbi:MAG: sodium:proton antiporter NhaD [Marinifilaceae bacterium]|nr:sodium:proton antiporter NhaD [Marinifilaceae bacterium]